jgi:hypothetical protein
MAKKKTSRPGFKRKTTKASHKQSKIPLWVWLAGGGVIVVLLVVGLVYLGYQGQAIANSDIEGLAILPDSGRGHEEGDIHDDDEVPASGAHSAAWQNCGIYDEPIREENVVHSMEHGAVWIAYRPDLAADQVEVLRNLVRQERSRQREPLIVLAPKSGLEMPIVATAWRVQLELADASDERLVEFVGRYQRGPYTPERGASCTGGVGEPLS